MMENTLEQLKEELHDGITHIEEDTLLRIARLFPELNEQQYSFRKLGYLLHEKIDDTFDEDLLHRMHHLLPQQSQYVSEPEAASWYALKSRVDAAEKEMDAGHFVTHEEAQQRILALLK